MHECSPGWIILRETLRLKVYETILLAAAVPSSTRGWGKEIDRVAERGEWPTDGELEGVQKGIRKFGKEGDGLLYHPHADTAGI